MAFIEKFVDENTGTTDNFAWSLGSDNTITITGYIQPETTTTTTVPNATTSNSKKFVFFKPLIIPDKINDKPVSTIDHDAFNGITSIKGITIPSSVTSIGDSAFSGCTNLQYLNLKTDSTLKTIGNSAFQGTAIATTTLPASVASIGNDAFKTTALQSVKFLGNCPDNVANALGNTQSPDHLIGIYIIKGKTGFDRLSSEKFTITVVKEMQEPFDITTLNPIYPLLLICFLILILIYASAKLI